MQNIAIYYMTKQLYNNKIIFFDPLVRIPLFVLNHCTCNPYRAVVEVICREAATCVVYLPLTNGVACNRQLTCVLRQHLHGKVRRNTHRSHPLTANDPRSPPALSVSGLKNYHWS